MNASEYTVAAYVIAGTLLFGYALILCISGRALAKDMAAQPPKTDSKV